MAKAGLQFSKKDEWNTPKYIVDFFGPFNYDPATTKEQADYLGIPFFDTIESDGLNQFWFYHKIWINPPFTKKFEFLQKAVLTIDIAPVAIYFLLPIESLTTKSFHEIVGNRPYHVWLPNGRIKFDDGSHRSSSPAFGSVVLEFNPTIKQTSIIPFIIDY